MIRNGYVATSVEDICAAAEVTKGAFFYHFANKEALARELLERFMRTRGEMLQGSCCGIEDPLDKALMLTKCVAQGACECDTVGCLAGVFAQELSSSHPELRDLCHSGFQHTQKMMQDLLEQARERHPPAIEFDAAAVAEQFVTQIQGGMLLAKASGDRMVVSRSLGQFRNYVRLLFGREAEA